MKTVVMIWICCNLIAYIASELHPPLKAWFFEQFRRAGLMDDD